MDAALGDALDLPRPAGRHVADLHPVVHHRAVELEGACDVGLAAEHLDQTLRAIHGSEFEAVKLTLTILPFGSGPYGAGLRPQGAVEGRKEATLVPGGENLDYAA